MSGHRFTLTPFDKALMGTLLPLIGTAVERLVLGASVAVVVAGLVTSALTGVGVFLKANGA